MLVALIIIWTYWSVVIFILIFGRRSWIPVPVVPIVLSLFFWLISLWSEAVACWGTVLLHLWITIQSLVEYYKCQDSEEQSSYEQPCDDKMTDRK